MKKLVYTFIAALLSVSLVSCGPEKLTSKSDSTDSSEADYSSETGNDSKSDADAESTAESDDTASTEEASTAENLTETKNDSTSESAAESTAEQQKYSFETFTFPTQIADVKPVKAKSSKCSELIAGQKRADRLFAMDDDNVYISKFISKSVSLDDVTFYKYNIQSDTLTELDETVTDYSVPCGNPAVVGDKIYSVYMSNDECMHYVVDTEKDTVDILKTESIIQNSNIAFLNTFPVNDKDYAEEWIEHVSPGTTKYVEHIVLYDENGNSREILKKDGRMSRAYCHYFVCDNKIYEYTEIAETSQAYLNTYDFDGNQLSEIYLKEISEVLRCSEKNAAEKFNVFGDFFAVQVYDETDCIKKLFIQNEKDETLLVLNDCWYIPTMSSATSENYIFGHEVRVPNDPNEPTVVDLYSMNSSGEIIKIAESLDYNSNIVSNGKAVAYIDNDELYIIKL